MASSQPQTHNGDRPRPNERPSSEGTRLRSYRKEYSLFVNVGDNQLVKAEDVIQGVRQLTGNGKLYACVAKASNMYMLTFADKTVADLVSDGLSCGGKMYECKAVKSDHMFVSFMNVDPYVPDSEIVNKLEDLNITVLGNIRRMFYEGTEVENGNRVCKVRLPKNFVSLPYVMKLSDGEITGMYRVIHDNQKKLCHYCHLEGHLFRDCPDFTCHRCHKQGHFKRQCTAIWCTRCSRYDCDVTHEIESEKESICSDIMENGELCVECEREMCVCTENESDGEPVESHNKNQATEALYGDFFITNKSSFESKQPTEDPACDTDGKPVTGQRNNVEEYVKLTSPDRQCIGQDYNTAKHIQKSRPRTREDGKKTRDDGCKTNAEPVNTKGRPNAENDKSNITVKPTGKSKKKRRI